MLKMYGREGGKHRLGYDVLLTGGKTGGREGFWLDECDHLWEGLILIPFLYCKLFYYEATSHNKIICILNWNRFNILHLCTIHVHFYYYTVGTIKYLDFRICTVLNEKSIFATRESEITVHSCVNSLHSGPSGPLVQRVYALVNGNFRSTSCENRYFSTV